MEFKPEDFYLTANNGHRYVSEQAEIWASLANARLAEMLAECPIVYSVRDNDPLCVDGHGGAWFNQPGEGDCYKARLVGITPLDLNVD